MKISTIIRRFFAVNWIIFCLIGISGNYTHYTLEDWIIVMILTFAPFVIYGALKKRKKSNSNNTNQIPTQETIAETKDKPIPTFAKYHEMTIIPNAFPAMENYYVLNEEEEKFFKCFYDELVKNKIQPNRIKLTRLSSGCFNVDHIDYCHVGKIHLCQPPAKYSVIKEGNKRATKIFYSLDEANEFISQKDGYCINPDIPAHIGYIQYFQGLYKTKALSGLSVEQCIEYIPYWIRYIKYCQRN